MSSTQKAALGEENSEDRFSRLPDDIVLNIFNKLFDAKWLCRCSIVSKRFASCIAHVQIVFISSNSCNSNPISISVPHLRPRHHQKNQETPGGKESRNHALCSARPVHKFLGKLQEIQSLHIDLCTNSVMAGDEYSLLKWGAKFGSKLEITSFLHPKSLREIINSEGDQNLNRTSHFMVLNCLADAVQWQTILKHLVPEHPMLETVVITDPYKRALNMCLSGERLTEFRNSVNLETSTSQTSPLQLPWVKIKLRWCYVPVLHLPLSGYIMEGVDFCMIKVFAEGDHDCDDDNDDDDGVILAAFEEAEGTYQEAVVEILAKHKNIMNIASSSKEYNWNFMRIL